MKLLNEKVPLATAAAKAGMAENTARRYVRLEKLPSEVAPERTWRTRSDPFEEVWAELAALLEQDEALQAKTLFEYLQQHYPGKFQAGQRRTLERRVKAWRALHGPAREVFFPQIHHPGEVCASDFTHADAIGVTIAGAAFPHLWYHLVLTYSNWEHATLCLTESFESLSLGLQNALFALGGVPKIHRTDRMSAAVQPLGSPEEFTRRYQALLVHYGLVGQSIQAAKANQNGDCEQSHYRFKSALEQALLLRGSRDFADRAAYVRFVHDLIAARNRSRTVRLKEETPLLRPLPKARLEVAQHLQARVSPSSTIHVKSNIYAVPSRLIGERVSLRLLPETLQVYYAGTLVATRPRLRGQYQYDIDYRYIIDWLVRKPGAFANYRYQKALFPTSRFQMAYDWLREHNPLQASRQYTKILYLAAKQSEVGVDDALRHLLNAQQPISLAAVSALLAKAGAIDAPTQVNVAPVDLDAYDALLSEQEP